MKNARSTVEQSSGGRRHGGLANVQSTREVEHRGKKISPASKAHPEGIYRQDPQPGPSVLVTNNKNASTTQEKPLPAKKIQVRAESSNNIITNPPEAERSTRRKHTGNKNAAAFEGVGMKISKDVKTTDALPESKYGRSLPTAKDGPFERHQAAANASSMNRNLCSRSTAEPRSNVRMAPQTQAPRPAPFAIE